MSVCYSLDAFVCAILCAMLALSCLMLAARAPIIQHIVFMPCFKAVCHCVSHIALTHSCVGRPLSLKSFDASPSRLCSIAARHRVEGLVLGHVGAVLTAIAPMIQRAVFLVLLDGGVSLRRLVRVNLRVSLAGRSRLNDPTRRLHASARWRRAMAERLMLDHSTRTWASCWPLLLHPPSASAACLCSTAVSHYRARSC